MAYSTIHKFCDRNLTSSHKRSDAKMKRYESTTDSRAWSNDKEENSILISSIIKNVHDDHQDYFHGSQSLSKIELNSNDGENIATGRVKINKQNEESNPNYDSEKDGKIKFSNENIKDYCILPMGKVETDIENVCLNPPKLDSNDIIRAESNELDHQLQQNNTASCLNDCSDISTPYDCQKCQKLLQQLEKIENMLHSELLKTQEISTGLNLLRDRESEKAFDAMEAELIFYKYKYSESERDILKLKEMLLQNEANINENINLKMQLSMVNENLKHSEKDSEQLIGVIERQAIENERIKNYKEKVAKNSLFVNIDNRENHENDDESQKRSDDAFIMSSSRSNDGSIIFPKIQSGKVQSIVEQLSMNAFKSRSNCKCKLENCKCELSSRISTTSAKTEIFKISDMQEHPLNEQRNYSSESILNFTPGKQATDFSETVQPDSLFENLDQTSVHDEVQYWKNRFEKLNIEHGQLMEITKAIESQRGSNQNLENEIEKIRNIKSFTTDNEEEASVLKDTNKEDAETCELKRELNYCKENEESLKSDLDRYRNLFENLQAELENSRDFGLQQLKSSQDSGEQCQKLGIEIQILKQQLINLQIAMDNEKEKSRELSSDLQMSLSVNFENSQKILSDYKEQSPSPSSENAQNRKFLINAIKKIKKKYDNLKKREAEMVNCYEKKIEDLQTRHDDELREINNEGKPKKNCICEFVTRKESVFSLKNPQIQDKLNIESPTHDELDEQHNQLHYSLVACLNQQQDSLKDRFLKENSNYSEKYFKECANNEPGFSLKNEVRYPEQKSVKTLPQLSSCYQKKLLTKKKQQKKCKAEGTKESFFGISERDKLSVKCVRISRKS